MGERPLPAGGGELYRHHKQGKKTGIPETAKQAIIGCCSAQERATGDWGRTLGILKEKFTKWVLGSPPFPSVLLLH